MLLKVIFLSILFCLTSTISNATISTHDRLTMVLEGRLTRPDNATIVPLNTLDNSQLIIVDNKLNLGQTLQVELEQEISKTQKELMQLNEFLGKRNTPKIGLVYIHKGYENWSLQFTYGGYLLNTKDKIIVSTSEVFELKEIFAKTKTIHIVNNEYQTTRYMSQLGAILHH